MSTNPFTEIVRTLPVNVPAWEPLAEEVITPAAWSYLAGGAGDEHTLRSNVRRWAKVRLAPHCLSDVSHVDTSVQLLGSSLPHPILLAPIAAHRLVHEEGEPATARGAADAGALFVQSTLSTCRIEEVAEASSARWWFQLYIQPDRDYTRELVDRAVAGGAQAIVLTVDTPVLGARDRGRRNDLVLPPNLSYINLEGLSGGEPLGEAGLPAHQRVYNPHLDATLTWADLEWLRSITTLPVVVKGVLRPDDAVRAVEAGAAAVVVSNHGGRNLDTVPATVDALPAVVAALDGAVPVLVDGGIRRGTDIAKALALGADAVMIGRPYLWGLAVDGANGVRVVVETLATELHMAMALLGAASIADLTPDLLWPTD